MRKVDLALLIGCVISIGFTAFAEFDSQCAQVRDNTLRLHILAPSDTTEDQALKHQVRDALLRQSEDWFPTEMSKPEAEATIRSRLDEIAAIASREIMVAGRTDTVQVELVNMFFETRVYGAVTVPAGWYDAVRITLGPGIGQNWWCVMFPPLCLPAAKSQSEEMAEQAQQILTLGQQPHYRAKFAVVELAEKLKNVWENQQEVPPEEAAQKEKQEERR